jgi:hypothetical protein
MGGGARVISFGMVVTCAVGAAACGGGSASKDNEGAAASATAIGAGARMPLIVRYAPRVLTLRRPSTA